MGLRATCKSQRLRSSYSLEAFLGLLQAMPYPSCTLHASSPLFTGLHRHLDPSITHLMPSP